MELDSLYLIEVNAPKHRYLDELYAKAKPEDVPYDISAPKFDLGYAWSDDLMTFIWVVAIAVFVVALIYILMRRLVNDYNDEMAEASMRMPDSIYGHQWDKELAEAEAAGDYSRMAVLCYLRRLHQLDASHAITFDQSKTPNMFLSEAEQSSIQPEGLDKLHTLTREYLRARYGHRKVSHQRAKELKAL